MLPNRTFDAVVHLAVLPGVSPSMARPMEYEITNVIGTILNSVWCTRRQVVSLGLQIMR